MTGKERLAVLADFLENFETTDERQFDLSCWSYKTECNTVSCAVGWATTIPALQADGLHLAESDFGPYPAFGSQKDFEATASFFDTSQGMTRELFSQRYYPRQASGPIDVARRIRQYLEANLGK